MASGTSDPAAKRPRQARRRRLGSRKRRQLQDYAQLFSLSIFLTLWAAIYRWTWLLSFSEVWGDVGDTWWVAEEAAIAIGPACAVVLGALAALNAAAFLDAKHRTRAGIALGAVNASIIVALSLELSSDSLLALELREHRLSGARSEGNIAGEIVGRWQVTKSTATPAGVFAGSAFEFTPDGGIRVKRAQEWHTLDADWEVQGTERFVAELPLCDWLPWSACALDPVLYLSPYRVNQPFSPPVVVLHGAWELLPEYVAWYVEMREPAPDAIVLRASTAGPRPIELAAVHLRRALEEKPVAGWDLGRDLAPLRDAWKR
jgi:hypothetical protein